MRYRDHGAHHAALGLVGNRVPGAQGYDSIVDRGTIYQIFIVFLILMTLRVQILRLLAPPAGRFYEILWYRRAKVLGESVRRLFACLPPRVHRKQVFLDMPVQFPKHPHRCPPEPTLDLGDSVTRVILRSA